MSFDWLLQGDYGSAPPNWPAMVLGLLIAFGAGQVIAWVYMLTHSGLSYSRSFVNSLIVMPPIVTLLVALINPIWGNTSGVRGWTIKTLTTLTTLAPTMVVATGVAAAIVAWRHWCTRR